jgi:hypothetical protein
VNRDFDTGRRAPLVAFLDELVVGFLAALMVAVVAWALFTVTGAS